MMNHSMGLLIGAMFGMIFVLVNAGGLPSAIAIALRIGAVLAFAGLVWVVARRGGPRQPEPDGNGGVRFGRAYWWIVLAEVVVGYAGILAFNGPLDAPEASVAWIALVVGAHFIALARVWRAPSITWVGGVLAGLGAVGLVLAVVGASEVAIATISGVGSGVVLLAFSWWAVTGN